MLWGRTQPGDEAKVDISLHSHNGIHVVRASVNIVRARGPIAARLFMERRRDDLIYVCVCVHKI